MGAAEHAMGIELQLEELVERRQRALVQGRSDAVARFDREIALLQDELATLGEELPPMKEPT